MSAKRKTTVAVLFGGRSVEHDVSVVTGNQVMRAFDPERYEVVPVYIHRDGKWFTGEPLLDLKTYQNEVASIKGVKEAILSPATHHHGLIIHPISGLFSKSEVKRLDVVFPALHGSHGEDGTIQGLCELADIAYVGCGVLGSALANDKVMTKTILKQHTIPVVDGVHFTRTEWEENPDAVIRRITETLPYPLFIKPATLGSSIGVGRADEESLLRASLEVAVHFDRTVLVEQAIVGGVEINCALLGNDSKIRASVLEQPISWDEFLTYEEKYLRGNEGMKSADRIIPAPLSDELTAKVKDIAVRAFKAIGGRGTARIDFLVKPQQGEVYLNEINTIPGSVAFYLWQHEGMSTSDVVMALVELARDAYAEKRRNTYNYQTNLIEMAAMRGLKGVKGAKAMRTVQS
jgi:D-alanine-D-alanine ligase